ncbi:erythromycin esterase family protein [Chitinophaga rhizosphaerae]|uniref:erythromycin esterase family protein n=1 Tax=Chitinophaga rhizosphaerae TaxID=1864947 RepID=UPI000F80A08A|nr:erythromycin esterase family protein [Chitinophaga rhizosphaerae]
MARRNTRQPASGKVRIFGFDREEYAADPLTRDKFMAKHIVAEQAASKARIMLWAHNVHIAKDLEMGEFKTVGYYMQQQYGEKYYASGTDTYSGSVHVIQPSR